MKLAFFSYFFRYVFTGPNRQRLIFLTITGLLISSFSLTVLQGIMGGLQNGLVKRSQKVSGTGYFNVERFSPEQLDTLVRDLKYKDIEFSKELELELMLQNGNYLSPLILHGVDFDHEIPDFLKGRDLSGLILGGQLAREVSAFYDTTVTITSPAHTSVLLREIPRQSTSLVSDFYSSELPEIDGVHGWVRIQFVQNLIRKRKLNRIRVYSSKEKLSELFDSRPKAYSKNDFVSWEKMNATLVWALGLETKVMLFLFISMSVLIGICIVSGFLIFYNKVKVDLASFWILGLTKEKAMKLISTFGHLLTGLFCFLGVGLGLLVLELLDSNQLVIMPEHFVERNIPVRIELEHILTAFLVPYLISYIFTKITFNIFKKEDTSFISLIKKVG
ncbi:MAG: hypothetical protein CME65_05865 [Halobacteriovoraceae bacterium]|nr:hypothetical protein [Halobacteriovoraceae bacterium]|tara:strand:+ start:4969 stop:6135 length:1167 start_codon:yes stop_codon:yes gene_type:complete